MITPEQRDAVVAEALTWLGTPYHHHGRVKGVGVDCAQILCAVYEASGVIEHVDPGFYPTDWHLHHSDEHYAQWLRMYAVQMESGDDALPGDIMLFRFGRCYSHGAIIVASNTVVHSYLGRGVLLSRVDEEPLDNRPHLFWRLK